MTTHHLDNESSLVRESCVKDVVDSVTNAGEGGVAADSGVGAGHVVVDGADETNDIQDLVRLNLFLGQFA